MLRVDKGRMGHREAYWPLDQRRGECEAWAKRKKRPPMDGAEDVWLVHVGQAAAGELYTDNEGQRRRMDQHRWASRRRRAEWALERIGDEEVSSGLGGEGVRWRRGGNLRRLGIDEQLLHDRLRLTRTGLRPLHLGVVVEAGGDARVVVGVGHVGPEQELVELGKGRDTRG